MLHGLYDNAETWADIAPRLAENYRIIALDRRGAGLTDKPNDGYDFLTLAQDVLELIDKLKLERVYLAGHSAGAGVALTVAAEKPEKIISVALIDGGFWMKRKEKPQNLKAAPPCNLKPVDCKRISAIEQGNDDYDAELLYRRVIVPTLLIMGVPPRSKAERFASELRKAQLRVREVADEKLSDGKMVTIKETGHWIQRDQPNELATVLKNFFK